MGGDWRVRALVCDAVASLTICLNYPLGLRHSQLMRQYDVSEPLPEMEGTIKMAFNSDKVRAHARARFRLDFLHSVLGCVQWIMKSNLQF